MRSRIDFWYLPPIPEEVTTWNDRFIELFCILSIRHLRRGYSPEEADDKAIEQVKSDPRFIEWS